ncbi:MAG: amidohydrolase family protein [Gemmatimonadota bacterium]
MRRSILALLLSIGATATAAAQTYDALSASVREYITVAEPVVALTHVQLIDGTGSPARADQTIVFERGKITWVGSSAGAMIPAGARIVDLTGHTVTPGFVGLHNHTFYYTNAPRAAQSNFTAPRLYLGAGVTTIRTTGSASPYAELNLKASVERGETPGPRLFVTGPYLISPGPDSRIDQLGMHALDSPEQARKVVRYWAEEGATWLKVYAQLTRATLAAITDEAHKHGLKVTGHLCSVGYREAIAAGIDGLEHGLTSNSEYDPAKQPDVCPANYRAVFTTLDIQNDPRVRATLNDMLAKKIALTSTLAVYEAATPGRPGPDPRLWDLLSLDAKAEEEAREKSVVANAATSTMPATLKKSMEFEVAFFRLGGILGAGVDPAWSTPAGLGDLRNYELLVEAGLTPVEAVQVMSLNGATVLGINDRLGSIAAGKIADLVVIKGDPVARPADIRKVTLVFRDGLGYDSSKLFGAAKGLVGIR